MHERSNRRCCLGAFRGRVCPRIEEYAKVSKELMEEMGGGPGGPMVPQRPECVFRRPVEQALVRNPAGRSG